MTISLSFDILVLMNSKLNQLFTNSEPLDVESVVSILKRYVRIKQDTNEIFFTENGNKVIVYKKILLFALARKLLKTEGIINTESFSAQLTSEKLQIKKGSIDSSFNGLKGKGFILGSGDEYVIPNYKIGEILALFKEENNHD